MKKFCTKASGFLYFGGGPGWSSLPDQSMLAPALSRGELGMEFWDEPSPLRPDGHTFFTNRAFHNWMFSASQFLNESLSRYSEVGVITHGFSTLPILKIIESQNLKVDQLVLISPYVDIYSYQKRLVQLSIQDFARLEDTPSASQLKLLLGQSRELFDWSIQQALQVSFHNPYLFDHFWQDLDLRDLWLLNMEDKESQLDLVSWQAVNQDLVQVMGRLGLDSPLSISTTVIIGERDPICKEALVQKELSKLLNRFEVRVFPNCSHFPHLESPDLFVSQIAGSRSPLFLDRLAS